MAGLVFCYDETHYQANGTSVDQSFNFVIVYY